MSMGGDGHVEVKDQAGKFVLLSNDNICAMKSDNLYDDIYQRVIK